MHIDDPDEKKRPTQPRMRLRLLRLAFVMAASFGFTFMLILADGTEYAWIETAGTILLNLLALPFGFLGFYLLYRRLHGGQFMTRRGPIARGSLHDRIVIALCALGSPTIIVITLWVLASMI